MIFTRRVYSAYIFDSYPIPLLRRFIVGAAIEKNFFYFFKTLLQLVKFWLSIPYQLLSFLVLYSFDYDLDLLHIVENYGFDIISRFRIFDSIFRLVFTRWILLASISTCFSIVYSMLWLFDSLSLLLVINKHLCLWEFVLCLFWLF